MCGIILLGKDDVAEFFLAAHWSDGLRNCNKLTTDINTRIDIMRLTSIQIVIPCEAAEGYPEVGGSSPLGGTINFEAGSQFRSEGFRLA